MIQQQIIFYATRWDRNQSDSSADLKWLVSTKRKCNTSVQACHDMNCTPQSISSTMKQQASMWAKY